MVDKLNLASYLKLTLVVSLEEARPRTIKGLAEAAFEGGVTCLQLREKNLGDRERYQSALLLSSFCRQRNRLFVVNDRLDLALAVEADGAHLGQNDLPIAAAAKICPKNKILGVSVSTREQALVALAAGADYLGVGAIMATPSKNDCQVIEKSEIKAINSLGAITVAIGGINEQNAAEIWKLGFSGLAVISCLTKSVDPKRVAENLIGAKNS
jgi:thiamine-phosphate diphosphorylase